MTCTHEQTAKTESGREYCLACGLRMISAPGPISLTAPDQRRFNWREVSACPPPTDRPIYVAGQTGVTPQWQVRRSDGTVPRWATHWAEDRLGLPDGSR